jgi:hypothetical protein
VGVTAKKKRGRGGDGDAEERVDTHSFAPKAGEAAGLFPEAVLLRKVRTFFFHPLLLVFQYGAARKGTWHGSFRVSDSRYYDELNGFVNWRLMRRIIGVKRR